MKDIRVLITAAGMGKRFGALTRRANKCLLQIDGKSLIRHILERLRAEGLKQRVCVVTGYQNRAVERHLPANVKTLFNPFYRVSGILGSFWSARPVLDGRAFLFTTSDHFFHPAVLKGCLKSGADVRIIVQRKKRYTKEDAKVVIRASEVTHLGKDFPAEHAQGEFGGMVYFSPRGSRLFYKELQCHLEKGDLNGYMMDILMILRHKHGMPIRYFLCAEDMRIEVDSVHDLIWARRLAKRFNRRRTTGL